MRCATREATWLRPAVDAATLLARGRTADARDDLGRPWHRFRRPHVPERSLGAIRRGGRRDSRQEVEMHWRMHRPPLRGACMRKLLQRGALTTIGGRTSVRLYKQQERALHSVITTPTRRTPLSVCTTAQAALSGNHGELCKKYLHDQQSESKTYTSIPDTTTADNTLIARRKTKIVLHLAPRSPPLEPLALLLLAQALLLQHGVDDDGRRAGAG